MVSAFNLSSTLVVVCALAGSSFASPLPTTPTAAVHASSPTLANVEQSFAQIQTEIQNSLKNLTRVSEWMFYRLKEIVRNTVEDGLENVATWLVDLVLRVETFLIADGSHYTFPLTSQSNLEEQYKTTAISVSKLLRNLKTMKRADALIVEVVKKVLDEFDFKDYQGLANTDKYFKTFLHLHFQTLDHVFTNDSQLGVEYKKLYAEAAEFVQKNPAEMHEPIFHMGDSSSKMPSIPNIETFLQDKVTFREVVASKGFLKQSKKNLFMVFSPTEHKRFLMANALIQKASSDSAETNKINEIYQQALGEAGGLPVNRDAYEIANTLFAALEKGLESEPELQKEIQAMMNERDMETVYDIDMLHLDFSLL